MAIVGTAYVRLRVIGDKLKDDISKATTNAVQQSAPRLEESGKTVGEHVSKGVSDSMEKSIHTSMAKTADDIGDQIGRRMAENMSKSLRKRAGTALTQGLSGLKTRITTTGDKLKTEWEKTGGKWAEGVGKGLKDKLGSVLMSAIALAVTALPSALAFAGAVVGAVGSTIVTALSSIGPAAAGAGLAAVAAFGTMKLSAGLFGLAMKAPSAALDDFKKRTLDFKATVARPIQTGLFSGFNAAMRMSAPIITALTPMLKEFGNNVGDIAINFAEAFRQGAMLERLQRILTVNNDAVKLGGAGVLGFAQAFAILFDHLSPVILFLASGVQQLGQWALSMMLAAEASGRLDGFISTMFNNLRYFVGILVDFGVGVWNVFRAAFAASGGMLTNLHDMAQTFRAWTGSTEGQAKMTTFFENMRVITSRVLEILGRITVASSGALAGTNVDSVLRGLNTMVTVGIAVAHIFNQIRDAAGHKLTDAFKAFADLMINLANSGVLGTLASAFANLFNIISMLLNIPGVGQLLALAAGFLVIFKTISLVMAVLGPVVDVIILLGQIILWIGGIIVGAFTVVPLIIAAVVAALIWFFTQTKIGQAIVAAVWDFIKNAISAAVDWIVKAWDWMVAAFRTAVAWVVNLAGQIWSAVSTAFNAVLAVVTTVFGAVRDFIVGVWNAIWGFIQPILQGIWNVISTIFGAIVAVIEGYLNILWQIWIRVWPILALPIRILYGVIILIFTAVWTFLQWIFTQISTFVLWAWNGMVEGIHAALTWVQGIISDVWNAVWGFIQPIIQAIVDFVVSRWNGLVNTVQAVLTWLQGIISSVWNAIWGFIQPIIAAIVGFVVERWNNLVNNVQIAMNFVKGIISTVWNAITDFIGGVMDKIGNLVGKGWDFVTGAGRAALDAIKSAVNIVIGAINTVIGGINWAIDLANKLPGPDIPNIPTIPKLARGGIVSPDGGGTLAMIAEAGRKERVEPLDSSGLSQRDRAMIQMLAGSAGNGKSVHVYLGTGELREFVDVVVEERENSLADRVLTGTKGS